MGMNARVTDDGTRLSHLSKIDIFKMKWRTAIVTKM